MATFSMFYRLKVKKKVCTWRTEDQGGQVLGGGLQGLCPAQGVHVHGREDVVETRQSAVLHPLHPAGEMQRPSRMRRVCVWMSFK